MHFSVAQGTWLERVAFVTRLSEINFLMAKGFYNGSCALHPDTLPLFPGTLCAFRTRWLLCGTRISSLHLTWRNPAFTDMSAFRTRCVCFGPVVFCAEHEFHHFSPYDAMPSRHVSVIYSRPLPFHTTEYAVWPEFQFIAQGSRTAWQPVCALGNLLYYPLSYRVPIRERYGSTLLPATREQHDQNCTQSH